jgi:cytochrome c-type biogenesis protein
MESLFVGLTHAVGGAPLLALGAALVWGVLSIILSPCHLASIPLIVGFIDGQGRISTRRAFFISSLFAIGILISIALIGAVTAAAGRMFGDVGVWGNWFVAGLFFVIGLHLLGLFPLPWSGPSTTRLQRKGLLAALLLGLLFGIALGPCTFAFMAPVLGVVFNTVAENALYAAALLLAYSLGHCALIVLAGTFTERLQHYLDWNERSQGAVVLRKICGLLVIAGGGWLLYSLS